MPGLTSPQNYPYPLYTEAANGAPQIQALADAIDDSIVAAQTTISNATNRKQCRASAVVNQSIPDNVFTTLTYTTENADTDNMINLGVNNTIATVNTAGHYLVTVECEFAANATGDRSVIIIWSGGGFTVNKRVRASSVSITRFVVSEVFNATVGQTFSGQAFQNSGGALNSTVRRITAVRVSG